MSLTQLSTIPTDSQGKLLYDSTWSPLRTERLITFIGGTTNGWGDDGGALDGGALFTVTGTVRMRIIGVVEESLVGAATANVGTSKDVSGLLVQIADATTLQVNEIWHDATSDKNVEASSVAVEFIVANGLDVLFYNGTTNITAGVIRFLVSWYPMSENALVVPTSD